MSLSQVKIVDFGPSQGGLVGTVGYTLFTSAGVQHVARTTVGIYELGTNTGIYGCSISFDDDFNGSILWDSGGSDPVYAAEQYNYQENAPTGFSLYSRIALPSTMPVMDLDQSFLELHDQNGPMISNAEITAVGTFTLRRFRGAVITDIASGSNTAHPIGGGVIATFSLNPDDIIIGDIVQIIFTNVSVTRNGKTATIYNTYGDSLVIEPDIDSAISENAKIDELHKLQGLDSGNPMTVTPTSRDAGAISQTISGDGVASSTVTRN